MLFLFWENKALSWGIVSPMWDDKGQADYPFAYMLLLKVLNKSRSLWALWVEEAGGEEEIRASIFFNLTVGLADFQHHLMSKQGLGTTPTEWYSGCGGHS